jgi:hypothetical protein
MKQWIQLLLALQGGYYLVIGLWPLVSESSFQSATGPKREMWLVKTTGLLIAMAGAVLSLGAYRRRLTPETVLVGAGTSAALAASDLTYALKGRISRIYLAEGVIELAFTSAWSLLAWLILKRR